MASESERNLLAATSRKDVLSENERLIRDVSTDDPRIATENMEIHIVSTVPVSKSIFMFARCARLSTRWNHFDN